MTTIEFNRISTGAGPEQTRGWLASVMLHLLGVAGAMFIMGQVEQPVLLEPFQWDISMVEAPSHTEPTQPESMPVEQVIQPPPPPVKPKPRTQTATKPITKQTPPPTSYEAMVPIETTQVVKEVVDAMTESLFAESSETQVVTSQVVMTEPVATFEAPAVEQRVVQQRLVHHRKTEADYGWLSDMIRKRIEELKRYPLQARSNHWEGKVVVQAVIKADGTVGDLRVAESSGHALLDEEALVVMRKASPLTLKHQLEKSHITILVPISYRLEG